MEKAILKTLAYGDIFDYPLKIYEIHKWLIEREATLRQVEKALGKLVQSEKCSLREASKKQSGYYFLPKRFGLVIKRKLREKQSKRFLLKAKVIAWFLKIIPWIKIVGVSGGLAVENSGKLDDIDLFIITSRGRLWLSRLIILGIVSLTGQRRAVSHNKKQAAGKICCNILIDEDHLMQERKDIYTAHEVLQMKVLWERDGIYGKYLENNSWAFKFLPNWVGDNFSRQPHSLARQRKRPAASRLGYAHFVRLGLAAFGGSLLLFVDYLEFAAKWLQLKVMKKPQGKERIEDGALYFHPKDIRPQVLVGYRQKVRKF